MDRYDILEAMSGIRDEYIEDAAAFPNQAGQTGADRKKAKSMFSAGTRILRMRHWGAVAAAVLCAAVISVTFRASQYVRNGIGSGMADSGVATMSDEEVLVEGDAAADSRNESAPSVRNDGIETVPGRDSPGTSYNEDSSAPSESAYALGQDSADVSAAAAMAGTGISDQVRRVTEEKVRIFENSLAEETGYSSLRFTHEITTDSDDWFSLRMLAYTSASDGFEQVTHFNISRKNAEYVTLETLFGEESDYIALLSEEVIRQMRERMAADEDAGFWLDSPEGPGYDFQQISPSQDFYFDSDGNLVLCFNEGEAAPTYMGTVEFTIPRGITERLLEKSL